MGKDPNRRRGSTFFISGCVSVFGMVGKGSLFDNRGGGGEVLYRGQMSKKRHKFCNKTDKK